MDHDDDAARLGLLPTETPVRTEQLDGILLPLRTPAGELCGVASKTPKWTPAKPKRKRRDAQESRDGATTVKRMPTMASSALRRQQSEHPSLVGSPCSKRQSPTPPTGSGVGAAGRMMNFNNNSSDSDRASSGESCGQKLSNTVTHTVYLCRKMCLILNTNFFANCSLLA